jgi:hypothetical protein
MRNYNNTGLTFVWRKQQLCNLTEITKIIKYKCDDKERQTMVQKCLITDW